MKQLMYLHKILNRHQTHWTQRTFETLLNKNIGWSKSIKDTLDKYNLPTDFQTIKKIRHNEWKRKVTSELEKENTKRLRKDCHKIENGVNKEKTKTKSIINHISKQDYKRGPSKELLNCTRQEAKTIMISRYRMLECGSNFKGTISEICKKCGVLDDETHRLNYCEIHRTINYYEKDVKVDFNEIYSTDIQTLRELLPKIERVWNTRNAYGSMNV